MKNYFIIFLSLLVLVTVNIAPIYAETRKPDAPHIRILDDAVMEKLAERSAAPDQNEILSNLSGKWRYDLKYWSSRSGDPELSTGTVENEMILDNRFFSSKTNLVLYIGGQAISYEGWNIIGYDTSKKAFTSVLLDTMRMGMMTGTAQYNEKNRTLEENGRFTHPLTGEDRNYRSAFELTDSDTHKRTFFITDESGQEFKVLEIEFHRQN